MRCSASVRTGVAAQARATPLPRSGTVCRACSRQAATASRRELALGLPAALLLASGAGQALALEAAAPAADAAAPPAPAPALPSAELRPFADNDFALQVPANYVYLETPIVSVERGPQPERSPVLARFEAPGGAAGAVSVIVRKAQAFKQTLLQVSDISQLGSPLEVAALLLPRGSTLLGSETAAVPQPAKETPLGVVELPPQNYYIYDFTTPGGDHVAMAAAAKRGSVLICGASVPARAWGGAGPVFRERARARPRAAAAEALPVLLDHLPLAFDNAHRAVQLLTGSRGLGRLVGQRLAGRLRLAVTTRTVEELQGDPPPGMWGLCICCCVKRVPPAWIATHAGLLRELVLMLQRTAAPITPALEQAPAPPGRACCGCCGCCGQCDWGESCMQGFYAGEAIDPRQEAEFADALATAAAAPGGLPALQRVCITPASAAILRALPATLREVWLQWYDDDDTTDLPAAASALCALRGLRSVELVAAPALTWGFAALRLDPLLSALCGGLSGLTRLVVERVADVPALRCLPASLQALSLSFLASPAGALQLGHLSRCVSLGLDLGTPADLANSARFTRPAPLLVGGEVLPPRLTRLSVQDVAVGGIAATLAALPGLRCLSILEATAPAGDLVELTRLTAIDRLCLGYSDARAAAAAAPAWLRLLPSLQRVWLGGQPPWPCAAEGQHDGTSFGDGWSADDLARCTSALAGLQELELHARRRSQEPVLPEQLAAALAPCTALRSLKLRCTEQWARQPVDEEAGGEAGGKHSAGLDKLVDVLVALPSLTSLHLGVDEDALTVEQLIKLEDRGLTRLTVDYFNFGPAPSVAAEACGS
ncbi:hypothetical protein HT031_004256 [Scenedesmus sp. PABB004]|nr:hypothetical protein HT031_004256 [Scenedesmus sp. PABB004]